MYFHVIPLFLIPEVRLFYRIREGALLFTIESILHGEERGSPGVPGGPDDVLQLDTSLVVEHPDDDSQSQVSASVQARPLLFERPCWLLACVGGKDTSE